MRRTLAGIVFAMTVASSSSAQPDAGACIPDREKALKMAGIISDLMRLATSTSLQSKESLDTIRGVATAMPGMLDKIQCHRLALTGKDAADSLALDARARAWAVTETATLDAEQKGRDEIVVPLCEATWELANARADIARERANPSGVVDLHELHVAGEEVQNAQDNIALLRPRYLAFRRHAFSDWKSEGACVAASKAAN